MPAAHEGRQDELDLGALAVDDGLDVVDEPLGDLGRALEEPGITLGRDD